MSQLKSQQSIFLKKKLFKACLFYAEKRGPRRSRGRIYILKYHLGEQSHVKRTDMCRKASGLQLTFLGGEQGRILGQQQGIPIFSFP